MVFRLSASWQLCTDRHRFPARADLRDADQRPDAATALPTALPFPAHQGGLFLCRLSGPLRSRPVLRLLLAWHRPVYTVPRCPRAVEAGPVDCARRAAPLHPAVATCAPRLRYLVVQREEASPLAAC